MFLTSMALVHGPERVSVHPPEDPVRPVPKCAQICLFLYSKVPQEIKVGEIWVSACFIQPRQRSSAVRDMGGGEPKSSAVQRILNVYSQ